MPENLSLYSLSRVLKLIKPISDEINKKLYRPFPRDPNSLLSKYEYYQHFVTISQQGYYSKSRLVTTLFDWSFVRSLVASKYSVFGPPCYDPCSLFLLDLFRVIDDFSSTAKFRNTLADIDEGKPYRTYAGITGHIPCEATFSHFRKRLGHQLYDSIHSVLVEIAYELHLLTGRIISYDGCLFPSHARFKGCTYATDACNEIRVNGDFIQKTHYRILNMLQNLDTLTPGKEHRSFSNCLSTNLPSGFYRPRVIKFLDATGCGYAIVAQAYSNIKQKARACKFHTLGNGWGVGEFREKIQYNAKKKHRFVVIRRPIPEDPQEAKQLRLFKYWKNFVFASNSKCISDDMEVNKYCFHAFLRLNALIHLLLPPFPVRFAL